MADDLLASLRDLANRWALKARGLARDAKAERRLRWIVPLGALLIRALAATWRVRLVNGEYPEQLRAAGKPVIFTLWHGHLLPLLMRHRYENVSILISEQNPAARPVSTGTIAKGTDAGSADAASRRAASSCSRARPSPGSSPRARCRRRGRTGCPPERAVRSVSSRHTPVRRQAR